MVKESDRHKAEDEVCIVPVPKILMQEEKKDENDKDDPFLIHEACGECLPLVFRKPFNVSMEYYSTSCEADD